MHCGSQSSAVKSNLYTSRCVGGPAPGSFSPPRTPQTASMINPTSASNTPGWQQGQVLDAPRDTMNMPLGWDEHSEAQSEEPHSETPHAQPHGTTAATPCGASTRLLRVNAPSPSASGRWGLSCSSGALAGTRRCAETSPDQTSRTRRCRRRLGNSRPSSGSCGLRTRSCLACLLGRAEAAMAKAHEAEAKGVTVARKGMGKEDGGEPGSGQ